MLCAAICLMPAPVWSNSLPPLRVDDWSSQVLEYQASKFFITVNTQIELRRVPGSEVAGALRPVPERDDADLRSAGENGGIYLRIGSDFLGRHSQSEGWMTPEGEILQLQSLETGHRNRYRRYRYLQDSVYSIKRFPEGSAEESRPWDQWSRTIEDRYPLPDTYHGQWLAEPESLLYLVPAIDWSRVSGEPVLPLFDPDGIMPLRLIPKGTERISVRYERRDGDGSRSEVRAKVDARVIRAEVDAAPGVESHNFKFLGYKGGVDIYLDPDSHHVLQIKGKVDYIGEVIIELKSFSQVTSTASEAVVETP